MNERLSRLVANLLAQAKEGEDPSSGINRVRTVIKKVIEGEETIFGKFRALLESFGEMIPGEEQRYQTAIKALSATSRLSRQEIVAAFNSQLEELKILETLLIAAIPGRSAELLAMEARSRKIRNDISGLREKIARLEKEEKDIDGSMAKNGTTALEKAVRAVFADIGAEITSVKKKVEELSAESAAQPVPDAETVGTDFTVQQQPGNGQENTTGQISSAHGSKPQKTCPMCGGRMSFSSARKMWQCFSCAYEELEKDEAPIKNREPGEHAIFPEPGGPEEPKKKCSVCGGRMDYYLAEKKWQCFSCAWEESEKDGVQIKKEELCKNTIFPEPASELKQTGGESEQRPAPEPAPGSELKQKCPMCGGQMDYYAGDAKWQCYACGFEYFKKDEGRNKSGQTESEESRNEESRNEEKRDHSNALLAVSPAESLFDLSSAAKSSPGYWESPKAPKSRPAIKKKTCPGCGKKMYWYGPEKSWRCNDCGYETRF